MKTYLLLASTLFLASCNDKPDDHAGPPMNGPMPVQVSSPTKEIVELTRVYTGRFVPVQHVDVRARVSGYINQIHFEEGQLIKKGEPLYSIDPDLFEADLAAAEARLEQVKAAENLARQNAVRSEKLIKRKAISREDYDARQAELTRAQANIKAAMADLNRAKLNRSYADINAPITGMLGRREITVGNYINGGTPSAPILTTIVPHTPLYCEFEVDERQVIHFSKLMQQKQQAKDQELPTVDIAISGSDEFSISGKLVFNDNQLDSSTATLQMRALVENSDSFLKPGLFARVKVPLSAPSEALLVPDAALGFEQSRRFAWVVKEDNTLERRYVKVGTLQGMRRIITSGLSPKDRIAVSSIQLLRPGLPIQPLPAQ